jgi:chromate transporter
MPLQRAVQWFSLLITAAAIVALWRYKLVIIPVIGACAASGLR